MSKTLRVYRVCTNPDEEANDWAYFSSKKKAEKFARDCLTESEACDVPISSGRALAEWLSFNT